MPEAFLGIGSNIGERISFIENSIREIGNIPSTEIMRISSVYETEPWGNTDQEYFLNCVLKVKTGLTAYNLLDEIKAIEIRTGRVNSGKWNEREIDIDLLFYGKEIISTDKMNIPHLQIEHRNFVLIPLAEISPDYVHPVFNKTVSELLSETKDNLKVIKYLKSKA